MSRLFKVPASTAYSATAIGKTADWQGSFNEYPLAPIQLGMIYESNFSEKPWVNLEQVICYLDDELVDERAMRCAFTELTQRHEVLRTSFNVGASALPSQVAHAEVDVDLEFSDWSTKPADQQDAALQTWLSEDRNNGVALDAMPPWHVRVFRMAEKRSVLVWTFHHASLDGRSFKLLLEEVFQLYDATRDGTPKRPNNMFGPSFSDHCVALANKDFTGAEPYFRDLLSGFEAANSIAFHDLPLDPETGNALGRKTMLSQTLDAALTRQIEARAKAAQVTVATMISAAWGIVLARASGRSDVVFGITRSGRHLLRGAHVIAGCLINSLPARITLSPDTTVGGLLANVRKDQIDIRPFEQAPLVSVMGWSDLPGGMPMFNSLVMFERGSLNTQLHKADSASSSRRFEVLEEGALPLTLAAYHDDDLALRMEYDPAIIPPTAADRLQAYLRNALCAMVAAPDSASLHSLDILGKDQTDQVLCFGRPKAMLDPVADASLCVASQFEQTAALHRDAPAVRQLGIDAGLTYGELDARANKLANYMCADGIGAQDLIAICLPRSVDFIVAMLAVMKCGAAYVPIDPSYPTDVIEHMLTDSNSKRVITTTQKRPNAEAPFILLDELAQTLNDQIDTAPARTGLTTARTAYVIYTSGSTGKPKGVMVSHHALMCHAKAISDTFELQPADRALQFASLSFDVSIEEIVPTLITGAALVLRNDTMPDSMARFLETVADESLSVLNLPTAFWHLLVDHLSAQGEAVVFPPSVRLMVVGGERVAPQALRMWQQLVPGVRWLNGYGPTETTITCTVHDPSAAPPMADTEDVPIGRPLAHAQLYVLNGDRSLTAPGVAGELWVGGDAVAIGYLGRPDLTAAAFHPDPFSSVPDARMYRTGDMVRWRADGTLDFLGRNDRQVKLRGYRIELRDIERVLEQHSDVGRAMVIVDHANTSQARLMAWVTPRNSDTVIDVLAVCRASSDLLAAHMRPMVIAVAEFPRTPGGKINVAALPRPTKATADLPPEVDLDLITQKICDLFAGILKLASVKSTESFYDLGGHSLLAIRLIALLEAEFDTRLSIATIHSHPTPQGLRDYIGGNTEHITPRYIVPIQPNGSRPPIFGVHVLGTNESYYRPMAEVLGQDQPMLGLTVGLLTEDTPTGVENTARLYFDDIQRCYPNGPLCLTAVSLGSYVALELAQQLLDAGREVVMLSLFDAVGPTGRPNVTGRKRVAVHLRKLRATGFSYLTNIVVNKFADLRSGIERARIRRAIRVGHSANTTMTIENFVAANEVAIAAYEAKPYPRRLTVIRATDNLFDSPEAISNGLGWNTTALKELDFIEIPGEHLSILQPPYVARLADEVTAAIDRGLLDF
jgi:amino acid adenylation domain-containing protein